MGEGDSAKPNPKPTARKPMSFLGGAGWSIALWLGVSVAVQLTDEARPGARADLVSVTACHLFVHLGLLFALLRIYEPESPVREVLALRSVRWPVLPLAALAGAGCYPTLSLLDAYLSRNATLDDDDLEVLSRLTDAHTTGSRVALALSLVVVAPLAEELFFRGFLYGALRAGRPVVTALIGTAAYYALAHPDPFSFGSTLTLGLLVTWLRAETGSLVPAALAHAAYAAVPVARLLAGRDPDTYARAWTLGGAAAAIVAAWLVRVASGDAGAARDA